MRVCRQPELEHRGLRSLLFVNPGLDHRGTTLTLRAGLQVMQPDEVAWAHRHSMAAIRFVVQGHPSTGATER
jgi:1-hydroxy-2-naphthoate dioxygenase